MRIDLSGRVALVTGAGRGIGRAIAMTFAQSGSDIAAIDLDLASAQKVADEISAEGRKACAFRVDVSRKVDVDETVRRVLDTFEKIDVLVNNAGVIVRKPLEEYAEDDWDRVISVNLKGTFNMCYAVGKHMISRRFGKIINLGSIMGGVALPPRASYCASKGGIIMFTKDLAAEWAKHNVTVNAISPGWIITELTANYLAQEDVRRFMLDRIPMGRFGEPDEIANVAAFLASDKASYLTGQNLFVDGGWTIQ